MSDRGIIFSGAMVRALLDGRKTMTRRIVRLPAGTETAAVEIDVKDRLFAMCCGGKLENGLRPIIGGVTLPFIEDDRLYVREAWRTGLAYEDLAPSDIGGEEPILFEADGQTERWTRGTSEPGRRRTSMLMPRWASRLTLIVEGVKVERVQEISEADAIAEGAAKLMHDGEGRFYEHPNGTHICGFAGLWEHLHAKPGDRWDDNPWVVAITFRVVRENIDQLPPPTDQHSHRSDER